MDATSFGGTHWQSPWRQRPAECGGPTTTGAGQKSLAVINYLYTHTHHSRAATTPFLGIGAPPQITQTRESNLGKKQEECGERKEREAANNG